MKRLCDGVGKKKKESLKMQLLKGTPVDIGLIFELCFTAFKMKFLLLPHSGFLPVPGLWLHLTGDVQ